MLKKDIPVQQKLFAEEIIEDHGKYKPELSLGEKIKRKEISDAHRSWKLYKSRKFDTNLTERDKFLLRKYYGVRL